MRRRILLNSVGIPATFVKKEDVVAGDVCFYDPSNNNKVFYRLDDGLDNIPETLIPIGVVAVPTSHNVYNTNLCAIISLVNMIPNTTGSIYHNSETVWGYNASMLPALYHDILEVYNNSTGSISGMSNSAYFPSDGYKDDYYSELILCLHDTNSYYYRDISGCCPSPYLTDGSRNTIFSTSSYRGYGNGFSDFNGFSNTKAVLQVRGPKDYSIWSPDKNNPNDYCAVSYCDMFYTNGTNLGDWYLPALGEMMYATSRARIINNALIKIRDLYNIKIYSINLHNTTWTSTRYYGNYDDYRLFTIANGYIYDGHAQSEGSRTRGLIYAFCKI